MGAPRDRAPQSQPQGSVLLLHPCPCCGRHRGTGTAWHPAQEMGCASTSLSSSKSFCSPVSMWFSHRCQSHVSSSRGEWRSVWGTWWVQSRMVCTAPGCGSSIIASTLIHGCGRAQVPSSLVPIALHLLANKKEPARLCKRDVPALSSETELSGLSQATKRTINPPNDQFSFHPQKSNLENVYSSIVPHTEALRK